MGYHQIRLDESSIPLKAFRSRYGNFEFFLLSLGNATAAFMNLMNGIFKDVPGLFVIVYVDDILIFRKTWEEHLEHIYAVLEILRKENLFA